VNLVRLHMPLPIHWHVCANGRMLLEMTPSSEADGGLLFRGRSAFNLAHARREATKCEHEHNGATGTSDEEGLRKKADQRGEVSK